MNTITIPGTIHRQITPNASIKYPAVAKNRLRQALKNDTILACQEAGLHLGHTLTPPIDLLYIVAWEGSRKIMDRDNLIASLKHAQDGIAHVLGIDDRYFREPKVVQVRDPDKRGFIQVVITGGEA